MVQSKSQTAEAYLQELPEDRREIVSTIREKILDNLPDGYVESMNWGMLCYEIPLETYPHTYNKQPLGIASIASQKNHIAIYMMGCYMVPSQRKKLKKAFSDMGVKPNMGKSCIRFTKLEKIPLKTILELIRNFSVNEYIKHYESVKKK
ncbi:MAG: DUF1801 domain-containing protein [Candidatus Marinimicrobia bacterium]|jgi:hypothetical protein|nr:DUF1801 domain-containing protein [Candidatus Neomarinimicrobiota bacterium]MBT3617850.1 DUF1801 domain-containing protein [Candidatus Neomarinimicrobiota bacterium]MBT3828207.1 DUF1801 domain-containing protein [Candidatus Neomarinimicrobiota bacterium]MBT3997124.1 DUF1801 domain-containing protein [Candidatus Neomarinimicrobiota bacterium]MBT4280590.1 DUF1801 domain-containing protein [Candidatus Neomarinimicrobiota bacterium]